MCIRDRLTALGVDPSQKIEAIVELTDTGIVIKPKLSGTPITDRIAAMDMPVADWEQMEQEIKAGKKTYKRRTKAHS